MARRCQRCGQPLKFEEYYYDETCWLIIEADNSEGYTAGTCETTEETEDDLSDM